MYKKKNIKIIYSIFLAGLPILNLYQSGIPAITLGEIGLIFFFVMAVFKGYRNGVKFLGRDGIKLWPINFFITLLFLTCLSILFIGNMTPSIIDIFNRFIRLALWALSISFTGYYLFEYEITRRWVIRVSIIATIYIIIQYIFWQLYKIYLPSVINGILIRPVSEGYSDISRLTSFFSQRFIRPASFFGEPAYYSYYSLVGIVLLLLHSKKANKRYRHIIALFISIGVFISTSTAGIYLMIMVWGYYIYKNTKGNDTIVKVIKVILTLLPIALTVIALFLIYYHKLETHEIINRFQIILSKPLEFGSSARLGGSYNLFNSLQGIQRFIGIGFGNEDIALGLELYYLNSITILLLSSGYLGVIIFFVFAIKLLCKKKSHAFILAIIYLLLCFTSAILYSSFSILYLTIIFYSTRNNIDVHLHPIKN